MTTASLLANVADGARQRTHDEGRACRLRFSGLRARRGDPFCFFEVSVRVCVCVCAVSRNVLASAFLYPFCIGQMYSQLQLNRPLFRKRSAE